VKSLSDKTFGNWLSHRAGVADWGTVGVENVVEKLDFHMI
jgi:hypothetical protein